MTDPAQQQHSEPPQPPEVERHFALYSVHAVGLAVLMLIPVLALFGVFGNTQASASAADTWAEASAEYCDRLRHGVFCEVIIRVRNTSDSPIDQIALSVSSHYLGQFGEVAFSRDPDEITVEAHRFLLDDVEPGEQRQISISLRGEAYWQHEGTATITSEGFSDIEVPFSTWVFP